MLASSRTAAAAVGCLAAALLVFAPGALAAAPATVTVRVEGLSETKLAPTQVTTSGSPVSKDGKPEDACPGTSGAGALELATGGSWSGKWFGGGVNKEGKFEGLGYSVETVLGESHPFGSGAFWSEWVNNHEGLGLCPDEMQPGAQLLLFACSEAAQACPLPLGIEAQASANVGESVPLSVVRYSATGQASPAAGATVTGAAAVVSTDSGGRATVSFQSAGQFTVQATAPESVRAETTICVHTGNDGKCAGAGGEAGRPGGGTSARGAQGSSPSSGVASSRTPGAQRYTGPFAVVASASGLGEGRVYRHGHAPRLLAGAVSAHTSVLGVSISLRRRFHGRCYAYDGASERFVRARCGRDAYFPVSSSASFSYLLPSSLPRGRYVFDIQALDAWGNHTTLARGTSRTVFYVG
jgi:hypothetical protein